MKRLIIPLVCLMVCFVNYCSVEQLASALKDLSVLAKEEVREQERIMKEEELKQKLEEQERKEEQERIRKEEEERLRKKQNTFTGMVLRLCPISKKEKLKTIIDGKCSDFNKYEKEFESAVTQDKQRVALEFLMNALGKELSNDLSFIFRQQCLRLKSKTLMQGKRKEAKISLVDRSIKRLNPDDPEVYKYELKDVDEKKKQLVDLYKIHIMPRKDKAIDVIWKFLELLAKNENNIHSLVNSFKFVPSLESPIINGKFFPVIVIYPASGKEKAQKLANIMVKYFKDYPRATDKQGNPIVARYNRTLIGPIDYAQGNADDKKPDILKKYFSDDGALYKNDFIKGDKSSDYELKVEKFIN